MENLSIKKAIRESGIFQWQVADALGISEATFTRWLRKPISSARRAAILAAINSVTGTKED